MLQIILRTGYDHFPPIKYKFLNYNNSIILLCKGYLFGIVLFNTGKNTTN